MEIREPAHDRLNKLYVFGTALGGTGLGGAGLEGFKVGYFEAFAAERPGDCGGNQCLSNTSVRSRNEIAFFQDSTPKKVNKALG